MLISKKIHYLIPISLAIGAFQVVVAVVALTINWMQLQEIREAQMSTNNTTIQQELEVNN